MSNDGFEFADGDQDKLKIGVRAPEPSNHPDPRMRASIRDHSLQPVENPDPVPTNKDTPPMVWGGMTQEEYGRSKLSGECYKDDEKVK